MLRRLLIVFAGRIDDRVRPYRTAGFLAGLEQAGVGLSLIDFLCAFEAPEGEAAADRPARRSGYEAGHTAYASLSRFSEANIAVLLPDRSEVTRLVARHLWLAAFQPSEQKWSVRFLKGMWAARREAFLRNRRLARDLREMVD